MPTSPKRFQFLLAVSVDLTQGQREKASQTLKKALANGAVRPAEAAEAILHLALLCGVPTCLDGLERLASITGRISLRRNTSSRRRGLKAFNDIYGSQADVVLRRLRTLDPFLEKWILRDVYGTVYSRDGFPLKERAIMTGIILGLQGLDRQSASHVRGALRLGTTPSELLRWIAFAERHSGKKLRNARLALSRFAAP